MIPVSILATEDTTAREVDEALAWATAHGVRVWAYIDQLLDARLECARD